VLAFFPFIGFQVASRLHSSLASVFDKRRSAIMQTAAIEIIWRNPQPPQRQRRWEQIHGKSGSALYLVQELVSTSAGSFWTTTSSLECVSGGQAA
jgi:hypothetical protein